MDSALITMEDQWGAAGEAEDIVCSLPQHVGVAFSRATKSNWEAGSREWLKLKEKERRKEGRKERKERKDEAKGAHWRSPGRTMCIMMMLLSESIPALRCPDGRAQHTKWWQLGWRICNQARLQGGLSSKAESMAMPAGFRGPTVAWPALCRR